MEGSTAPLNARGPAGHWPGHRTNPRQTGGSQMTPSVQIPGAGSWSMDTPRAVLNVGLNLCGGVAVWA